MRIVYSLANGAVIAAAQWDSYEPSTVETYPAFNPSYHGSFTKAQNLLPGDFSGDGIKRYNVDDTVTPTDVVEKNHFTVELSGSQLQPADGSTRLSLTVTHRDPDGLPLAVSSSTTVNLVANNGFLENNQVTILSGQSSAPLYLYTARTNGSAVVSAYDSSTSATAPDPAILPGHSPEIYFVATASVPTPMSPQANQGAIPKPEYAQHSLVNFYNGKAIGVGVEIESDVSGSSIVESPSNGSHVLTKYENSGVLNDVAGFNAYRNHITAGMRPRVTFVFSTNGVQTADTLMMFGFSKTDISATGGLASDIFVGLKFLASEDTEFSVVVGTGSFLNQAATTAKPTDDILWRVVFEFKTSGYAGPGLYVSLLGLTTGHSDVLFLGTGSNVPSPTELMGVFAFAKCLNAGTVGNVILKNVYVQHD